MNRVFLFLCIICGLGFTGKAGWAERAYITDSFEVTFRTGPSVENRVIAALHSGQPVEILESQEPWSRVRVLERAQDQMEGWVLSRYLIKRMPWKEKVESLRNENERIKKELDHIRDEYKRASAEEKALGQELNRHAQSLEESRVQFEELKQSAGDYLNLKAEHATLQALFDTNQRQVRTLTNENARLKVSENRKWFAIGSVVLLFGLLLGLIIGRQQKRSKFLRYD